MNVGRFGAHVYFAERVRDRAIKIGLSRTPQQRVAALTPGLHRLLAVHWVGHHEGEGVESDYHARFAHSRVYESRPVESSLAWTEYFWPTDELLALIASLTPEKAA